MQIGLGITVPKMGILGGDAGVGLGVGFFPGNLFLTGAQGAWYDPSDFSTLFQNSTGTTPVTAVEQPVRLMLDRSRGLVLGGELVVNGSFATDSDWTKGAGWTITGGQAVATAVASGQALRQTIVAPTNISYWIEFDIVVTSGGVNVWMGTSGTFFSVTSSGLSRVLLRASGANDITISAAVTGFTGTIDNVSIKALPGNHALAPNDASRPVLRSRYNLLTYSEQFDNGVWESAGTSGTGVAPTVTANQGVAPNGTTTADRMQFSLGGGTTSAAISLRRQSVAAVTGAVYTFSIYIKSFDSNSYAMQLQGVSSGVTAITVTPTWQRFAFTDTAPSTNVTPSLRLRGGQTPTNSDTADVLVWGADLKTAADQTATGGAYQRIAAATDYDTSNPVWRPYLAFDGTDDSLSTSSIDFSGTDEMTVFAGLTKLSDAGRATVVELGTGGVATETFFINAPRNAATDNIGFASAGSSVHEATASGVAAPITRVVTGIGDISGDVATLRLNGVQAATNTGNQGTGNYANAALFIGRRNNMFDPLNGRLYSLAVLGRTATAPELSAMEAWVAGKTGVTI